MSLLQELLALVKRGDTPNGRHEGYRTIHDADEPNSLDEESRDSHPVDTVVEDSYRLVYLGFFFIGVAMLLPWNVFITASEFFLAEFTPSPYSETFQNYFSVVGMTAGMLFATVVPYIQTPANVEQLCAGSLFANMLIFLAVTLSTLSLGSGSGGVLGPTGYFYFILLMLTMASASCSFMQNASFSLAARFPPLYTQALMSGQAVAGTISGITQIVSAFGEGNPSKDSNFAKDLSRSAFLVFLISFIGTTAIGVTFIYLLRMPFYTQYASNKAQQTSTSMNRRRFLDTFKEISSLSFSVAFVFVITLALFPSITAFIKSVQPPEKRGNFQEDYLFVPLGFFVFNLGDLLGRIFSGIDALVITNAKMLTSLCLSRLVFVPIFLASNVEIGQLDNRLVPLLVKSDTLYMLFMLAFGTSNGYLSSLVMMAAPQAVSDRNMDYVGSVMVFSLNVGLVIGSLLTFPLTHFAL